MNLGLSKIFEEYALVSSRVKTYMEDIFSRHPENTRRAYEAGIRDYRFFCLRRSLPVMTSDLETNTRSIKEYVKDLCQSDLSYSSIKVRLAALSVFLEVTEMPNPLKQSKYLKDFIRLELSMNHKYKAGRQANPLTIELLDEINEKFIPDNLLDLRNLAIINTMYDALLRSDELVRVCVEDISQRHNTLKVRKAKTDQEGMGSERFLSNTSINLINEYINEANTLRSGQIRKKNDPKRIGSGILFRAVVPKGTALLPLDGNGKASPLEYSTIYRVFEKMSLRCGLLERYSCHSPRVGAAVTMAEEGEDQLGIQRAGAWKSTTMPARYTEKASVKKGAAANVANRHKR